MKLKSLELWNYGCYQHLFVMFDNKGLTLIRGLTGAGKSTIFNAITYALHDKVEKNVNLEDLPNWFIQEDGKIHLTIEDNSQKEHIIEKIISQTGKSKTKLYSPGDKKNKAKIHWTNTDHKNAIRELIEIDFETFINSSYIQQGEISKIITGTNSDRVNIFSKFQDLHLIETARQIQSEEYKNDVFELEKLKEKKNIVISHINEINPVELEKKEEILRVSIKNTENELKGFRDKSIEISNFIKDVEENNNEVIKLRSNLDKIEFKLNQTEENLFNYINESDRLLIDNEEATNDIKKYNNTIVEIDRKIDGVKTSFPDIQILESQSNDLKSNQRRIKEEITKLVHNETSLKSLIDFESTFIKKIEEKVVCPECNQKVTRQHKNRVIEERKEKIKNYKEQLKELNFVHITKNNELIAVEERIEKTHEQIVSLRTNIDINKLKFERQRILIKKEQEENRIKLNLENVDKYKNLISETKSSVDLLKENVELIREQISKIPHTEDFKNISLLKEKHYTYLNSIEKFTEKLTNYRVEFMNVNSGLSQIKQLKQRLKKYKESEKLIDDKMKYHSIAAQILSKNGLRIHKIETMLDHINRYISLFQTHFSDPKILSSEFAIDNNGKIALNVWMNGLDSPKSVNSLSGGETEMVAFPVTLAFFFYIASRNYSNVLFIDEGLVFLDERKKEYVADILTELKNKGVNIFIISHDPHIQDFDYDYIWNVSNDGQFAHLIEEKR